MYNMYNNNKPNQYLSTDSLQTGSYVIHNTDWM